MTVIAEIRLSADIELPDELSDLSEPSEEREKFIEKAFAEKSGISPDNEMVDEFCWYSPAGYKY